MIAVQPAGGNRASCTCLMIVGNVERTIRQSLDSTMASGCFDEYVIVQDTRIKDRTTQILEGYRARFPQIRLLWHEWKTKDYSAPRNLGLSDARMDRCFWIDGDETLMDPMGIYSLLQRPERMAYHIWQVSPTPYQRLVWTHQLRLFPRLTGVKWELPIHEQLVFSIRRLGIPEEITPYRVWHLGYIDEATNTTKHRERAQIMRDWLRRHPQKDQVRAYIEEQYLSSMLYLRNIPHAGRHIRVTPGQETEYKSSFIHRRHLAP